MKKAFSMIEVIFVILLMGIIAAVAIPKFNNLTNIAKVSAIKQDVNTIITSIQNYVALHGSIDKISQAVTLDTNTWDISDTEVIFKDKDEDCITISINEDSLDISVNEANNNKICQELLQSISEQSIEF
jgi:general secretion pathway protein G